MTKPHVFKKIAFLGGGQMAEALIGGMLTSRVCQTSDIWATDPLAGRREILKTRFGVQVGERNGPAMEWADVVVLAVKPQSLADVMAEAASYLNGKLVLSIAAGIPLAWIRYRAPAIRAIIRAMPNTPALVHEGITALAWETACSDQDLVFARNLFESVGRTVDVEERLIDAVTGLSGSGPAYVFVAIEALADGGIKVGLPRRTAELLAAQTVLGAARLVMERGEHPACLKDQVASPGGTTIAGLHRLEEGGFRATLMAAVEAATKRSEELGRTCL
ncbi:MAG TPA: pyrroline-5-carboxylate reductase [Nitrospiraceae bacterium]|nr:pyrroline-5-carboxylate reductase [Nitrospiraceae bacterium]